MKTETAIIGAGQTGVPLARALSDAGRRVVLFEREHLGGWVREFRLYAQQGNDCLRRLAADAKRGAALGRHPADVRNDFPAVMDRARRLANEGAEELVRSFARDKYIQLIREHARIEGETAAFPFRAGNSLVQAERVVLDTGNRTARPRPRFPVWPTIRSSPPRA